MKQFMYKRIKYRNVSSYWKKFQEKVEKFKKYYLNHALNNSANANKDNFIKYDNFYKYRHRI